MKDSFLCARAAMIGIALLCCHMGIHAQDSTFVARSEEEHYQASRAILPASLIVVGTFGVYNGWCHTLRNDVREGMTDWSGGHRTSLDNYIQYVPAALHLSQGWAGIPSRHSGRERVAAQATAWLVASILNNGMKYTIREPRPDTGRRNSFPSGHTVTAFTGAELTRLEYGTWPGLAAYTMATGVALARLYNDRHWTNDVVAGAGIGILSARIGYWLLPAERRWFGWQQNGNTLVVVPAYAPASHSLCLSLSMNL